MSHVLLTDRPPLPANYRSETEYDLTPPKQCEPSISDRINDTILKGLEIEPGDRPQTVEEWLELLKSPQPKPLVRPQSNEPQTVLVPPKNTQVEKPRARPQPRANIETHNDSRSIPRSIPKRRAKNAIEPDNNKSDRVSQTVTRRNWLKYSGLAITSMVVALVGKNIVDKISERTDDIELAEYEFDVITVNDKGEEINREQNKAKYFTEDLGNGITLEMVEIPGGTFIMGSPEDEPERDEDESPQHEVTVPSFYMAKFQVTQYQWGQVVAMPQIERELKLDPSNSSNPSGEYFTVEKVTWYDAVEFCKRLSKAAGKEYRLPSEAEWEYACRAETTTPFHFGEAITTDLVNYNGNYTYGNAPKGEYRETTTPVGSFPPNAFGLYDMHGNVSEWCADTWHDSYEGAPSDGSAWVLEDSSAYVLRGGSWNLDPQNCRSAYRYRNAPDFDGDAFGFRCVADRTL